MNDRNTRPRYRNFLAAAVIVIVIAIVGMYVIVTQSGHWLVEDDDFKHATWAVILDGQSADMERNDYVASLLAEGKVDSVIILGRRVYRNRNNAEFYADDFMRLGKFDSNAVFVARHDDPSTVGEAFTIIPWLKSHKADTVVLVTAAPATRRAKRIFTKLSGESPIYLTVDVHHYQYSADSWIFNRESRKNWIREWAALANSYYDLFNVYPLSASDSTYYSKIRSVAAEQQDDSVVDLQKMLAEMEEKSKAEAAQDTAKADSAKTDSVSSDTARQAR